jgi:prepilin-type N-terminal cleavage/methylation domain-containing protein
MIFGNKKGFTLLEILVASAVIMVAMPLITSIMISSMEDYISGTKLIEQQGKINNAYSVFRKDVEMASDIIITQTAVSFAIDPTLMDSIQLKYQNPNIATDKMDRIYSFELSTGNLKVEDVNIAPGSLATLLDGIDNSIMPSDDRPRSGFFYIPSEKKMWIKIFPKDVNTTFFKGRNFGTPITIYFDVFNKKRKYFKDSVLQPE